MHEMYIYIFTDIILWYFRLIFMNIKQLIELYIYFNLENDILSSLSMHLLPYIYFLELP